MRRVRCRARRRTASALLALALMLGAGAAQAHYLDSALLSLTEVDAGSFRVYWHASSRRLQEDLGAAVVFPKECHLRGELLACGSSGLVGAITFPWLEGTMTRVVVDVQWRSGLRLLRIATPSTPSVRVYGVGASGWRALLPIVTDYTALGIEHILTGFDHLLFVVALTLLVGRRKQLLATITAFTVAHSISLALTVLGLVHAPEPPVEASIALSIVLVCAECLRPGNSLAHRAPWVVAFSFGLLHGLGFASALLALGMPEQHVPAALVCFNVGVELGQLAVIAVVLTVGELVTWLRADRPWLRRGLIYTMGSLAAYWSIDRIGAVLGF